MAAWSRPFDSHAKSKLPNMSTVPFTRQRQIPLPSDLAKKLPSNLEAERSILGAILMDNASITVALKELKAEDFFIPQNRIIFQMMKSIAEEQTASEEKLAIDTVILNERLEAISQLEAAGGAPYIASLIDAMPRVTNVAHYAKIVRDKATLRNVIHATHNIQMRAFEGEDGAEAILQNAEAALKSLVVVPNDNPSVVVGFKSLLDRECAPQDFAIEPLLTNRGTGEIFAPRGMGKSMIATWMAMEIATGAEILWGGHRGAGGHWPVSRSFRQLYVYGEMDESEVQARARTFARMKGLDKVPSDEQLGTMCMDYQKGWRPKISSARDRRFIEDRLFGGGYEGLWLDNLSTLWPSSAEAEGERDAILADWYADLNQRGIWVIWLHHAGKSGQQRGGSAKEDMLSFVLKLATPGNYKQCEQLRVECHVDKHRHKSIMPTSLSPFEIQLTRDAHGSPLWVTRPAKEAQRKAAFEMFKNEMPTMLVAQDLSISRATAYRWKKDFEENPNPDFHLAAEAEND
jgi:hypothetical protein